MLLYEYRVRDEFRKVRELASAAREKFKVAPKASDLWTTLDVLQAAYDQLAKRLPPGLQSDRCASHLNWVRYGLRKNSPAHCADNLNDICEHDLRLLENAFANWCGRQEHYDPQLRESIAELLVEHHLDSAVRKAFVVLTERLRQVYGVAEGLDGSDLVNKIFGSKGLAAGDMVDHERERIRNLLDGLYGVFRNPYDHADVKSEWYEADAAVSMVNWVLKWVAKHNAGGTS
jgi:hypothetical protein